MLYPKKKSDQIWPGLAWPVYVHLIRDNMDYLRSPMTDQKKFNDLALENILVSLTREIGDVSCFLH